jgi:hypothetical protein
MRVKWEDAESPLDSLTPEGSSVEQLNAAPTPQTYWYGRGMVGHPAPLFWHFTTRPEYRRALSAWRRGRRKLHAPQVGRE